MTKTGQDDNYDRDGQEDNYYTDRTRGQIIHKQDNQ